MSRPENTPVVVGVGELKQRPEDLNEAVEAAELMTRAARRARDDAGADVLSGLDLIGVVAGAWSYRDPGALIAERLGAAGAVTLKTTEGGHSPVGLFCEMAERIRRGELSSALMVGGEVMYTRRKQRAAGLTSPLTEQPDDVEPDEVFGSTLEMVDDVQRAAGLAAPVSVYPMFENALRAAEGESIADQRARLGRLYSRFSEVAARQPVAWQQIPMTPDEVATVTSTNRMVGFPYPKSMNSNWWVDQAAAVVIMSAARAAELGVDSSRWIHPQAGVVSTDTSLLIERSTLAGSRSLEIASPRLLELTRLDENDVGPVDLYSCFPSAVRIGARALGLSEERDLTLTGGMSFFGGPLNNYAMHSLVALTRACRDEPDAVGLTMANGGYFTKHALVTMSAAPPERGWVVDDVTAQVLDHPRTEAAHDHVGEVEIEAYTVMHDKDGPEYAVFACRTPDRARCWARSEDPETMALGTTEELCGRVGTRRDGTLSLG